MSSAFVTRVLVTGAGGFLGGHLCAVFAAAGHEVRGLDIAYGGPFGGEAVTGSILDEGAISAAMAGCGAVIHAAAMTDLWAKDPAAYDRVNAGGTALVARAARQAGAQLVHVSSYTTLVARAAGKGERLDETAAVPPEALCGPYPASKRRGELAVLAEAARGLRAVIVLPSAPIGPGDHRPTPPGRLLRDLYEGRLPALLDTPMNLVCVRSVAEGCLLALRKGKSGERYLLCGDDAPLPEIAQMVHRLGGAKAPRGRAPYALALTASWVEDGLAAMTGRRPAAPLTGVRLAGRAPLFSNAKAKRELGFAPPPLEEALREALRALQPARAG